MALSLALLHVYSHYSFGLRAPSAPDLAQQAARLGYRALALTDRAGMHGLVPFFHASQAAGLQALAGCELPWQFDLESRPRPLILLAQNATGYRHLSRLVSLAHGAAARPFVTAEQLAHHAGGMIVLSGGAQGEIAQALLCGDVRRACSAAAWLRDRCGANGFYLELPAPVQPALRELNAKLVRIGKELGIRCVAADPAICLPALPDPDSLRNAYREWPDALECALAVADRCAWEPVSGVPDLPDYPAPDGMSQDDYLRQVAAGAAERLYGRPLPPAVDGRLDHELSVISARGLAGYFLILWDAVQYARRRGIPVGPGRGSAVGSLVAYCLGLSEIDPLQHNLYFERFLNPERPDLPDIDLDLCHRGRAEVIQYVIRRHGQDRVAHVGVINTLGARGAVRAAGKEMGLDPDLISGVAKLLPQIGGKGALRHELETSPEFARLPVGTEPYQSWLQAAQTWEGAPTHASIHAAGVIITRYPTADRVPLSLAPGGERITQYGADELAELGIPKFDFLGLKNLTIIQDTLDAVRQSRGIRMGVAEIPLDDSAAWRLIGAGATIGCFQMESPGMRRLLRVMQPKSLPELMAALSFYRPGAWDKEALQRYLRSREKGAARGLPRHLAPILSDTYGVLLYQEQVLRIAHEIGGLSLAEADRLRKALSRRSAANAAEIDEFGRRFCAGAVQRRLPEPEAERIFQQLLRFRGYSFNKAHISAYALTAYRTAYLKAHFAPEYLAAHLACRAGYYGPNVYWREAARMGIPALGPDVNASQAGAAAEGCAIRGGLLDVPGIGPQTALAILRERAARGPFRSHQDFLHRLGRSVSRRALQGLRAAGAFDSLPGGTEELRAQQLQLDLFPPETSEAPSEGPVQRPIARADRDYVAGPIISARRQTTRSGRTMLFLLIDAGADLVEVAVPPEVYQSDLEQIDPAGVIVRCRLRNDPPWGRIFTAASIHAQ